MENIHDFIGPFEIRGKLGKGAMAVVWRAYDPSLEREVAIKEPLIPEDSSAAVRSEFSARFVREAIAAARLNHPGIVTIYSASVLDGRPVIVMELIEGHTLRTILQKGPLTTRQSFALMDQLLLAVGYAHEHGVTHRDLKPDNVFVTPDGVVKLADFGIAQLGPKGTVNIYNSAKDGADTGALTRFGTMLGTPAYMAPEQIRAESVDSRCDVFALGVIAYECLSGHNPFGDETNTHYATILHRVMSEPAPPLEVEDSLANPLGGVVMRALKKERENRFTNAVAMRSAWLSAFSERIDSHGELAPLASDAIPCPSSERKKTVVIGTMADKSAEPAADDALTPEEPLPPICSFRPLPVEDAPGPEPATPPAADPPNSGPTPPAGPQKSRRTWVAATVAACAVVLLISGALYARAAGGSKDEAQNQANSPQVKTVTKVVTAAPAEPSAVALTAKSSKKKVTKGQSAFLSIAVETTGTIDEGAQVVLERRYKGGSWEIIKTLPLSSGRAGSKTSVTKSASFRFRFLGSPTLREGTSKAIAITYKAPPKRKAAPAPVRRAKSTYVAPKKPPASTQPAPPPPPN